MGLVLIHRIRPVIIGKNGHVGRTFSFGRLRPVGIAIKASFDSEDRPIMHK